MRLLCREIDCDFAFSLDGNVAPASLFMKLLVEHMNLKNHHKFLIMDASTNTRELTIT
jgi:hypothetical protein